MFTIPTLFSIVLKHSNKAVWSDRKKVSVGLTSILNEDARAYISETDFNKYFSGQNKGRTLYAVVQDEITEKGFSRYIFEAEKRLINTNYRENKFCLAETLEDFFEALEESQNLPKTVLLGLKRSFQLNHADRPYLFLVECLYYALAYQHNKDQDYIFPDFSQETDILSSPLEELISRTDGYSKRVKQNLNRLSEDEIKLFQKVAPFLFYDESYDELSGDYVLDYYLISHANFVDLFEKYGVSGMDISRLKEYGLIDSGGKHEIIVEKGVLSGFQNDNLVLTFTTELDKRITFEYSAFHFTETAKALIEILEVETNDEFFQHLAEYFKYELDESEVIVGVYSVEELE